MENLFTKALRNQEPSLVKVIEKRNRMISKQRSEKKQLEKFWCEWSERENLRLKNEEIIREKRHKDYLEIQRKENKTISLNMSKKNKIKNMLKILNGLPPYNTGSNICYGDGYYSRSIPGHEGNKEYDTAMDELIEEFGEITTWKRFEKQILSW